MVIKRDKPVHCLVLVGIEIFRFAVRGGGVDHALVFVQVALIAAVRIGDADVSVHGVGHRALTTANITRRTIQTAVS